jgi:hypothetical protein
MAAEIIGDLEGIHDSRARFRRLLQVPFNDRRADPNVEFAVRLWDRRDRRASAALREVDT